MILKLLFSVLLGFIIGLEREHSGKVIGVKTVSLVTLGTTLFTLMSPTIINGDNARIIAAIIQGVGILCAGVIMKNGDSVKGLTTAATLFASAAIGCLIGSNMFLEALAGTLIILIINLTFNYFKNGN